MSRLLFTNTMTETFFLFGSTYYFEKIYEFLIAQECAKRIHMQRLSDICIEYPPVIFSTGVKLKGHFESKI